MEPFNTTGFACYGYVSLHSTSDSKLCNYLLFVEGSVMLTLIVRLLPLKDAYRVSKHPSEGVHEAVSRRDEIMAALT